MPTFKAIFREHVAQEMCGTKRFRSQTTKENNGFCGYCSTKLTKQMDYEYSPIIIERCLIFVFVTVVVINSRWGGGLHSCKFLREFL